MSTSYRFTQAEIHATTSIHHEAVLAGRNLSSSTASVQLCFLSKQTATTCCSINVLKNPTTISVSLTGQRRPLFSGDLEGVWPRPSLKV